MIVDYKFRNKSFFHCLKTNKQNQTKTNKQKILKNPMKGLDFIGFKKYLSATSEL